MLVFLICVIDISSKYAWVIPLKDKKGITISDAFQKILDEFNCKPNKIWVDKGSEFHNSSMKSSLKRNTLEIFSTHNEGKSAVTETFIRTLKKICKYMISILINVYIDKLDHIVNKYKNTYHKTIKMKLVNANSSMYIDVNKENNKVGLKFKVGDNFRISKYKTNFAKGYFSNWSKEFF